MLCGPASNMQEALGQARARAKAENMQIFGFFHTKLEITLKVQVRSTNIIWGTNGKSYKGNSNFRSWNVLRYFLHFCVTNLLITPKPKVQSKNVTYNSYSNLYVPHRNVISIWPKLIWPARGGRQKPFFVNNFFALRNFLILIADSRSTSNSTSRTTSRSTSNSKNFF